MRAQRHTFPTVPNVFLDLDFFGCHLYKLKQLWSYEYCGFNTALKLSCQHNVDHQDKPFYFFIKKEAKIKTKVRHLQ